MGRLTHRTSPGWTYFVTTKSWQSRPIFQVHEIVRILIDKLLEYREKGGYLLHEFVVMPNHLHLILTPQNSVTLEKAMQLIKGGSSHDIHIARGNETQIWQSGFHESRLRDFIDYKRKADYVWFNPVTAKLVERPEDWPYGSASENYRLDAIPQGLKPPMVQTADVGPEGPTPNCARGER
jgi:putative transposase